MLPSAALKTPLLQAQAQPEQMSRKIIAVALAGIAVTISARLDDWNRGRAMIAALIAWIAASEVEGLVLGQVRRLLASPELVARTITAVRRENGGADHAVLEESEVIDALGALEPVWDELYPAEQARILRMLIERIEVARDGISLMLHAAGIRSLVAELADQEPPPPAASEALLEAAE